MTAPPHRRSRHRVVDHRDVEGLCAGTPMEVEMSGESNPIAKSDQRRRPGHARVHHAIARRRVIAHQQLLRRNRPCSSARSRPTSPNSPRSRSTHRCSSAPRGRRLRWVPGGDGRRVLKRRAAGPGPDRTGGVDPLPRQGSDKYAVTSRKRDTGSDVEQIDVALDLTPPCALGIEVDENPAHRQGVDLTDFAPVRPFVKQPAARAVHVWAHGRHDGQDP